MRSISAYWRMAWVGLLLVVGLVAAPTPTVSAAGRVALVVGNSTYAHIGRLPNPENDAADMAAALGRLGFDVTTVRDADRVAMKARERTSPWCSTPATAWRWTA